VVFGKESDGYKLQNCTLSRSASKTCTAWPWLLPLALAARYETWKLIRKRASLLRSGRIRQTAARRMKRKVHVSLKEDKRRLTAEVGENIVSELVKGNVQEAFRHLKGWYRNASETQARPCHQTMECQTNKRVELYAERAAYGEEFPENGMPFDINDNPPSDGELRTAVSQLSHGRCRGSIGDTCRAH